MSTIEPLPNRRLLELWLFFALAAGGVELAVLGTRSLISEGFLLVDANAVWMTPLSSVALLAPMMLVVAAATRLAPRWVNSTVAAYALAQPAIFAVFFLAYPRIHGAAIILLSLGASVQVARLVGARGEAFAPIARRASISIATCSIVGTAAIQVWSLASGRQSVASLPSARVGAPNVLLLILDTVRAQNLSLYGHDRPTSPGLDALAASSVVFEQAFSTAPWTLTSHASMFTGRYPFELSAHWTRPLDGAVPTLAEALAENGYRTAGFVANVLYTQAETGLARGFHHYDDYQVSPTEIGIASSLGRIFILNPRLRSLLGVHDVPARRKAPDITKSFLEWVGPGSERPFFAFLNFYDAHEPYLPPESFARRFSGGAQRQNHLIRLSNSRSGSRAEKTLMSGAERDEEQRAYDAAIASIDVEIQAMLDTLSARGLLDNTILVVTADHGELFGEHGLFEHGGELYAQVLRVPLIFRGPGDVPASRVSRAVSLADLPATILDLARIQPSRSLGGASLAPLWRSPDDDPGPLSPVFAQVEPAPNQPSGLPSGRGPMRSLIAHPWHYILNGDGVEELYDLSSDPEENVDLASAPDVRDILDGLRADLRLVMQRRADR